MSLNQLHKRIEKNYNSFFSVEQLLKKLFKAFYYKEERIYLHRSLVPPDTNFFEFHLKCFNTDKHALSLVQEHQPHKAKLFERRIADDITGLATFNDDNVLIGYGWWATKDYYEPKYKYTVNLRENQVYQFDGYVNNPFRRDKLGSYSMWLMWQYFLEKGFSETVCLVLTSNIGALKWHAFSEFKELKMKFVTRYFLMQPISVMISYHENYFENLLAKHTSK